MELITSKSPKYKNLYSQTVGLSVGYTRNAIESPPKKLSSIENSFVYMDKNDYKSFFNTVGITFQKNEQSTWFYFDMPSVYGIDYKTKKFKYYKLLISVTGSYDAFSEKFHGQIGKCDGVSVDDIRITNFMMNGPCIDNDIRSVGELKNFLKNNDIFAYHHSDDNIMFLEFMSDISILDTKFEEKINVTNNSHDDFSESCNNSENKALDSSKENSPQNQSDGSSDNQEDMPEEDLLGDQKNKLHNKNSNSSLISLKNKIETCSIS